MKEAIPARLPTNPRNVSVEANPADHDDSAILIEDVFKSFGDQKVLDGVSFTVARGATLAVLGRSGTGKSVLLKIIVGLQKPDRGKAVILGTNVAEATASELSAIRVQMGFLFQNAALYDSLNVEDNVAFPLVHCRTALSRSERRDRVEELLREVGLEGHMHKMPASLSGGMKKRVGLARALALDPVVLLLDEPTAGLDPIGSREIDELILKLQREHQMASIVVTHDLLSAKNISTRIALLDQGRIVIEGNFDELQSSDQPFVGQFFGKEF